MRRRRVPPWGATALVLGLGLLASPQTLAHLMPAERGTLNLVGDKAYLVLSIPVAAFSDVKSCADGSLSAAELKRDTGALRRRIREALTLETAGPAKVAKILLNLPSGHGHGADGSEEVLAMIVAQLAGPNAGTAELTWRLWPHRTQVLKVQATRTEAGRTVRSEVGVLSKTVPSYRFFSGPDR